MWERPPTEYVIIIDLDILGWDLGGIVDSFSKSKLWDVVCSHGVLLHGIYRDTYAFRSPGIDTNHHRCGQDHGTYNITYDEKQEYRKVVKQSQHYIHLMMEKAINDNVDLVPASSCFGGLAVYR
jgi:hypothetical protein